MYIEKWWGSYAGGSDDSFLLLDYFGSRPDSRLSLHRILKDLHLHELLKDNKLSDGDAYFEMREGYVPHFDMAVDVLIDLSTVLLESLHSGSFAIQDLDKSSKDVRTYFIESNKEDLLLLIDNLEHFIQNTVLYEISELMDEESLSELVNDCTEIKNELKSYILD